MEKVVVNMPHRTVPMKNRVEPDNVLFSTVSFWTFMHGADVRCILRRNFIVSGNRPDFEVTEVILIWLDLAW